MTQWFRMYAEVLNDPKAQKLPGETFKAWVNILCLTCQNDGTLPAMPDIAFALRTTEQKAEQVIKALVSARLIDESESGLLPHNWNVRQYKSDVSTPRVKRFRERRGNVSPAVSETPPETDTEAETEQNREGEGAPAAPPPPAKAKSNGHGTRIPDDWCILPDEWHWAQQNFPEVDLHTEEEKFRDYWLAQPGVKGRKTDWNATFRNWIRKAAEYGRHTSH